MPDALPSDRGVPGGVVFGDAAGLAFGVVYGVGIGGGNSIGGGGGGGGGAGLCKGQWLSWFTMRRHVLTDLFTAAAIPC